MRENWRKGGRKGKQGRESERQKEERGGGDGKREYRGVWGQGRGREGKTASKLA